MKFARFSPPSGQDDFGSPDLLGKYSDHVSSDFNMSIAAINAVLTKHMAGTPQFYNPVTHGIEAPDTLQTISWNGFPRRFSGQNAGAATDYAAAEPDQLSTDGKIRFRQEDEYLEWFVHRDPQGRIVRVDFTCEAWDYFNFLATANPGAVVELYRKYVAPDLSPEQVKAIIFKGGDYDPWNDLNLTRGAMHLTHPANALGAEIKLAADGTLRRNSGGHGEPTSAAALIECAKFGDGARNSDPKIGYEVNQLARAGYMVTLTDPVGLYMVGFSDAGWKFADGTPATGFMKVTRGRQGKAIRAVYELPDALKAAGKTISDINIGKTAIAFGGHIAEHITMGIEGAACKSGSVTNKLVPCGPVPTVKVMEGALLSPKARM